MANMAEGFLNNPRYWEERWKANRIGWHRDHVHPTLYQHFPKLSAGRGGDEQSIRIFVPLCGKSVDMLWLAELGHEVVGVELVREAIETFFTEKDLGFTTEEVDVALDGSKATLFRCIKPEGGPQISILQYDIFSVTEAIIGGKFHAVWDRASLVAINPVDREKYVNLLATLLYPGGRVLLDTFRYEHSKNDSRPPFSVSEEELRSLFRKSFSVQELRMEELEEIQERQAGRPGFSHRRFCHLLTLE